jgi:3alpha(or 20beta)-hydroxysteroid dehydrogenase
VTGRLDQKVAIVTGGARGTGAVIAHRFAEEGARVVIADVLDERGEQVAATIGESARFVHCDVSREDDWAA